MSNPHKFARQLLPVLNREADFTKQPVSLHAWEAAGSFREDKQESHQSLTRSSGKHGKHSGRAPLASFPRSLSTEREGKRDREGKLLFVAQMGACPAPHSGRTNEFTTRRDQGLSPIMRPECRTQKSPLPWDKNLPNTSASPFAVPFRQMTHAAWRRTSVSIAGSTLPGERYPISLAGTLSRQSLIAGPRSQCGIPPGGHKGFPHVHPR